MAKNSRSSVFFQHNFVDVAPHPVFARLLRADYGMLGSVKMLRGVPVLRGIATADMAASQAQAQMHPTVSHLEALFAALTLRFNFANLVNMRAGIGNSVLFSFSPR